MCDKEITDFEIVLDLVAFSKARLFILAAMAVCGYTLFPLHLLFQPPDVIDSIILLTK